MGNSGGMVQRIGRGHILKKGIILCIAALAVLGGCGEKKESRRSQRSESSVTEEVSLVEESETASEASKKKPSVKADQRSAAIISLTASTYFIDSQTESVIYGTIEDDGGFGTEVLQSTKNQSTMKLNGMEYIIVFKDDNSSIENVFCGYEGSETVGCKGKVTDIADIGVSDWNELVRYYTDPTYERAPIPTETRTYSGDDIRNASRDGGITVSVTVTADKWALDSFGVSCNESNILLGPDMVGYMGANYYLHWDYPIESAELTMTYDPELIFVPDQSEKNFKPAIYYFTYEEQILHEVKGQTTDGYSITVDIEPDKQGYYLLLNKVEVDEFYERGW